MSPQDRHSVRRALEDVMRIEEFSPPATPTLISDAERRLGTAFPPWLSQLYLACNGFLGPPIRWRYLYSLEGDYGVLKFTEFVRREDWAPAWLSRAIVFGGTFSSGSDTVYWSSLDGRLIEWCLDDVEQYTVVPGTFFDLCRREQAFFDSLEQRKA